jgi:ABC-type phosphate/phosphonate transport system ATPase subunit
VDEPTTGLDSVMAASVVQQLKVYHIREGRRDTKLSPWKFVDSVLPFVLPHVFAPSQL